MEKFFHEINRETSGRSTVLAANVSSGTSLNEKTNKTSSHELIAFPDENLSTLQIQAMKKRN